MGCFPHVGFHESMPKPGLGLAERQLDAELWRGIILARNQPRAVHSFMNAPRVKGSVWLTADVITGK